jgi:hypothetical protein
VRFSGRCAVTASGAVLLACALTFAGCATGQKIDLTYEAAPTEGMTRAPGVMVHVPEFEDRRAEPDVVGEIQSGFWESTVHADEKIRPRQGTAATWAHDALVEELKLRGYKIVKAADKPEWQILGRVLELNYSEGGMLVTRPGAVVTIECELVHNDRPLFVETYWNSATAKSRPGDPAQLLETVLRRDLTKFLEDFEAQRKGLAENG